MQTKTEEALTTLTRTLGELAQVQEQRDQLVEAAEAISTAHLRMRPNHEEIDRAWRNLEAAIAKAKEQS